MPDTMYQREYDPDFSPPSSDDYNPTSEASFPSRPATPPSPKLAARLERLSVAFLFDPDPPKSAIWYCPATHCNYNIDLLDLAREQLDSCEEDEAAKLKLRLKNWSCADDWVVEACKKMARAHYHWHLRKEGIKVWRDRFQRVGFCFIVDE